METILFLAHTEADGSLAKSRSKRSRAAQALGADSRRLNARRRAGR